MTTSRSPERLGPFLLACTTALLALALVVWFIATAHAEPSASRSFYDSQGRFAGSSIARGSSLSFYNARGGFAGSSLRIGRSTTFYDRQGRYSGTVVNTGPGRGRWWLTPGAGCGPPTCE
jgi:hypothetical protein